jgi:nucleotide-binding universal stress UspA family protein
MSEHGVIVGYASSDDDAALDWAAHEAKARDVHLTICHVWRLYPRTDSLADGAESAVDWTVTKGAERAERIAPGLRTRPLAMSGSLTATLLEMAEKSDLIVVGSRGYGPVRDTLIGSVTTQIAAQAVVPAVVVRGGSTAGGGVIVGTDGSALAEAAVDAAFAEARLHGLPLTVLRVWSGDVKVDRPPYVESIKSVAEERFRLAVERRGAVDPSVSVTARFLTGDPGDELVKAAKGARLLVVGSRGINGIRALFLGSVSQAALHHAPCPVMVVH